MAKALQDACVGWEDHVRQGVAWPMLARSAIEAMREPTDAMVNALADQTDGRPWPPGALAEVYSPREEFVRLFNNALDAALKENTP